VLQVNKLSLKSVFTPLFLLIFSALFLSTLTEQILTKKVEALISSKDGLSNMIWVYVGISLLSAILFPLITAMLSSFSILKESLKSINPHVSAGRFIADKIELSLIETMRAWGTAFLWSFVFILPGIWKLIAFILTPYVVMFSKKYQAGEVDALEYSTKICKAYFKRVNWWLTVFYLFVPVVLYFVGEPYRLIMKTPAQATVLVFIRTIVEYLFHYYMIQVFIDFINEYESEPALAVAVTEIPTR
jgi:hypothetical protein